MPKNQGLGRGLSSLIPPKISKILPQDSQIKGEEEKIIQIPITEIKLNPLQPRQDFNHLDLEELIDSIKEHGILQPLIVSKIDKGFQLITGERRLRAAQFLDLKSVPAVVRKIKKHQYLELALIENLQRKNLNSIEEAVAFQRLIEEFNLTQEEVAKKIGKSRSVIANTLRLLNLPSEIQKALISEKINYSAARLLVSLPSKKRLKLFRKILKNNLTVRATEGQLKKVGIKIRKKKIKDPNLLEKEEMLSQALGTKVDIKKSGQAGQIIIEFYSKEDLEELFRKITKL